VKLWIDAQLWPALATWVRSRFQVDAIALRDLGLRDARDPDIFQAARRAGAVVLTKDSDFVDLVLRHGPPPAIVWLTTGNTSTRAIQDLLEITWPRIAKQLEAREPVVELRGIDPKRA